MTKKQVTPDAVVREALELLDAEGADAVTMRAIADRLGVRMNTVLWHAKSKARLLELLADAILAEVPLDDLPEAPHERAHDLAHRYRQALLTHRDGARVVAGTYAAEPATLRFADTLVQALLDAGHDEQGAAWTCWTLVYFTLGLVQEEQALPHDASEFTDLVTSGAYPALARTAPQLTAVSFDERFDYGLKRILAGPVR